MLTELCIRKSSVVHEGGGVLTEAVPVSQAFHPEFYFSTVADVVSIVPLAVKCLQNVIKDLKVS